MSTDERRALGIILALLLIAAGARWVERPRPLLPDVPDLDLAALEAASRDAQAASPRRSRERATSRAPRGRGNATSSPANDAPHAAALIDPNTASATELATLPGVGPALAARIIAERERAPFRTVDDLRRVQGIGATLAQRLARHVSLAPGPAPPGTAIGTASTPLAKGGAAGGSRDVPTTLDINEMSSTDLQRVPGVGPVLAARLIARRDSLGGFSDWQQIDAVVGVGPALLERLRGHVFLRRE